MEKIGEARNDVAASLLSHQLQGVTLFFLGDVTTARSHLEQSHGLGDPVHRAACAAFVEQDPHVTNLAHLAIALIYLGYIDLGRARMNEALSEARGLLDHTKISATDLTIPTTHCKSPPPANPHRPRSVSSRPQIPIGSGVPGTASLPISRGFLPWRFSDAGPGVSGAARHGPASQIFT